MNGILLLLFHENKQTLAVGSNSFISIDNHYRDSKNRMKLPDTVIVSKSIGHLHDILPPWEDTVEIKEGTRIHPRLQAREELTESILWRARLEQRLGKGLRMKHSQQEEWSEKRNRSKYNMTIFTLNYNAGPVQAVRHVLEPLGVNFIDHSHSVYCELTRTCLKNLQALNRQSSFDPSQLVIDKFYEDYKHNEDFRDVDMFLCIDPPAICELFLPFNKSLFVLVGSRYELGHSSPVRWKIWNDKLKNIASNQRNIVATTNTYDAEYMLHFTQIFPMILQYPCQYITYTYSNPQKVQFILFPLANEVFRKYFMKQVSFHSMDGHFNISVSYLEENGAGRTFSPKDTIDYQGMIMIPNDASSLRMTEIYRMNIPIFVPTIQLLSRWHLLYHVIAKRTLPSSRNPRDQASFVPSATTSQMPDPNNERDISTIAYWLQFLDIYIHPHIILFSSFRDLLNKMESYKMNGKLKQISKNMRTNNKQLIRKIKNKWINALDRSLLGSGF